MGDIRQDHIPEALLGLLSEKLSAAELHRRATAGGVDFSTMLMGTITWDVSVGELLTRPMASAFGVEAFYTQTFHDDNLPSKKRTLEVDVFPRLFDGKPEGTRRVVHMIASNCPDGHPYRVAIRFSDKAAWRRPSRFSIVLARKIVPSPQSFVKGQEVLQPFEVKPRWFL